MGLMNLAEHQNGFVKKATGSVEISCETDLEYDVVEFRWKLRSFNRLREIASENGLPPEGDVVTSPMYIDSRGGCWWLRVYPYQLKAGYEGNVSVFLHTDRPNLGSCSELYFSLSLVALDSQGRPIKETLCGTNLHKFKLKAPSDSGLTVSTSSGTAVPKDYVPSSNYGFYDFIDNEEILEQVICSDSEGGESEDTDSSCLSGSDFRKNGGILNLYCRILVYNSLITTLKEVKEEPKLPTQRLFLVS